jgi:hypothetical protein
VLRALRVKVFGSTEGTETPLSVAAGPRCAYQRTKRAATKKLDNAAGVKIRYVLYMACHNNRAWTLNWRWAWPLRGSGAVWCHSGDPAPAGSPCGRVKPPLLPARAGLDTGGLKVGQRWERILSTDRQSASLGSPESGAGREGLGTGDSGPESMASCVRASSPRGTGGSGLALSAAGYYKRNNLYNNIHITYKIKHTPILQNEAD